MCSAPVLHTFYYIIYTTTIFYDYYSNNIFTPLLYNNVQKSFAPYTDRRAPWTAHGVGSMLYLFLLFEKCGGVWA
jgi:hypothetical protein